MKLPFKAAIAVIVFLSAVFCYNKLAIDVPADRIYVVKDPIDGELHVYTTPGIKNQNFGELVGDYPKFTNVNFDIPEEDRDHLNYDSAWSDPGVGRYGVKVTFGGDNGTAIVFGSIPVEMPLDAETIKMIQSKHGGWEGLRDVIIRKQLVSSITQVGSTMTSREANAERRSDLIGYIEDMVKNGVYQTRVRAERDVDPITRDTVIIRYGERIPDKDSPGGFKRQAASEINKYQIRIGTPAINYITFSPIVRNQLMQQQQMTMDIATSKAQALVSQQRAKTSQADAEAQLAKVQADLNADKERAIIEAEKRRDVAQLDMQAAEFAKKQAILEGEGEAEKKRLLMSADGALNPKLDAWLASQQAWAAAWKENGANITPVYSTGGSAGGASTLNNYVELMGINAAKQLGLDMTIKGK
jgi:regulator of protease activity HflC (stomatin/prohibitin superfamily)